MSSYDVTSLFTSVPIDQAFNIIKDLLEKDEKLNDRTVLLVQNIIELLGFCVHNTYFSFQNKFYEQVEGASMGSLAVPLSPICTWNVLKERLSVLLSTPRAWCRFVDDTWVIQKHAHKQEFLDCISSVDPAIKFTVEGTQAKVAIPFLDTLVTL